MGWLHTWLRNIWLSILDKAGPLVILVTAAGILYTRSVGVAYYAIGAICCSLSAKAIKRLVRQPRPAGTAERSIKRSYGMPSTHSASISYLATYSLLASLYLPITHVDARFIPVIAIPWAVTVTMSRVWLGHHTWPQVFAGASYGIAFASAWFRLWRAGLNTMLSPLERVINAWIDGLLRS